MAQKNLAYQQEAMNTCLEKFEKYASQRGFQLLEETYGFYEVRHNDTKRILGAVKVAFKDDEEKVPVGWIVNWADRQRKFVSKHTNKIIVGKKTTAEACLKEHLAKQRKQTVPPIEDDDMAEL